MKNILIILSMNILGASLSFFLWLCIVYILVFCLDIAFNFGITFNLVFGIASSTFIVNIIFKSKKIFTTCVEAYEELENIRKE